MKRIITIVSLLTINTVFSQVAIGKTTVTNSTVSLEFYDSADNTKGMLLPWVSTVKDSPVVYNATTKEGYNGMQGAISDGTIIFDLSDYKVKYMKAGIWSDLTPTLTFPLTVKNAADVDVVILALVNPNDPSIQDTRAEETTAKVAIGANGAADNTNGILVLTDTNKAMILPKVASPHLKIQNPAAGMIAYDTVKRQLAVFNGTVWSFWKP